MEITFEKDRVNNFTDAVFAIAMTLLILEVPIPDYKELNTYGFTGALSRIYLELTGYMVSFVVTGLYWNAHMKFSRYLKIYSNPLFTLNLFLLLFIVFIPFSTGFFFQNFSKGPYIWYAVNLLIVSLFMIRIVRVAYRTGYLDESIDIKYYKWIQDRLWGTVAIWCFVIIVATFSIELARFLPLLMIPLLLLIDKKFKNASNTNSVIAQPVKKIIAKKPSIVKRSKK